MPCLRDILWEGAGKISGFLPLPPSTLLLRLFNTEPSQKPEDKAAPYDSPHCLGEGRAGSRRTSSLELRSLALQCPVAVGSSLSQSQLPG